MLRAPILCIGKSPIGRIRSDQSLIVEGDESDRSVEYLYVDRKDGILIEDALLLQTL